jgi:predicted Zn-dependent peptidase
VEATGGSLELHIDADLTRYTARVPAGDLDAALEPLADMLSHPRFGIVDLAVSLGDTLGGDFIDVDEDLAERLWPEHPVARPGGGTRDTLEAISLADVAARQEGFFGARNIALAVVGPVEADAVFQRAESALGLLPAGSRRPVQSALAASPLAGQRTRPTTGALATVLMAFPTAGTMAPEYPTVELLGLLLSGPDGLLFQDVRNRHGLARDVDALTVTYSDVGSLLAAARVQSQNIGTTLDRYADVFERLRRESVDAAVLQRLRDRRAGERVLSREVAEARAEELASRVLLGRPLDDAEDQARIAAVTPDDLRRAAERYLAPERAVIRVSDPGARR